MNRLYLVSIILLALSLNIIISNSFSYGESDVANSTTSNGPTTKLNSNLMNDTTYFLIKYIQEYNKNGSIINKTAIYDSDQNEATIEYNNSTYYKTLTKQEEDLLKKTIFDINFFELPHAYPMTLESIRDEDFNSYNLTVSLYNMTNSVYWIEKQQKTVPSGLELLKDTIESWLRTSTLNQQEHPITIIKPSCGPIEGFPFNIMTNGFAPNRTVHWELLDQNKEPTLLGYFETNSTGGFNETTDDFEISPGKYQLHVYDDIDNDAEEDFVGKETFTELASPCSQESNSTSLLVGGS